MTQQSPSTPSASAPSMTSYHDGRLVVWGGDCLALMAALAPGSVDAIVTDPPYGLGFMGQKWDTYANEVGRAKSAGAKFDHIGGNHNPTSSADAARTRRVEAQRFGEWCEEWCEAAYRVLKPGGHILAFGGTRTWHRLAVGVEDAGFEIRDSLAWLYGSGFPKSMDVSKAIDKAAAKDAHWAEADSSAWEGWGTALKPAFEPIVMGRKPLPKKATVASNVLLHGTGALNIDGCRIGDGAESKGPRSEHEPSSALRYTDSGAVNIAATPGPRGGAPEGRWPANVILDESQAAELDRQAPKTGAAAKASGPTLTGDSTSVARGKFNGVADTAFHGNELGGASRFFYAAKAPKSERPVVELTGPDGAVTKVAHPTVKPVAIMRWLVRLVTPPDGLVLDPFAGTGTTGEACVLEGFRCLLAEDPTKGEQDYLPLIDQRITRAITKLDTKKQEQTA